MRVLHLSETTLSGSPYRTSKLYDKYSGNKSRHIVFKRKIFNRVFPVDLVGEEMQKEEIQHYLDNADVLHFHNLWKRQSIFKVLGCTMPKKPMVIQIHSPRASDNWSEELASGVPLAIIAQYHVREWPERSFVVPNCIDITEDIYTPLGYREVRKVPLFSYAPSNANGKGWDNKSYSTVMPILKRARFAGQLDYKLIFKKPHIEAMFIKREADYGIDEVSTGSYHMSSLEYLSQGIACICNIDSLTEAAIKEVTGCDELPFIKATEGTFVRTVNTLLRERKEIELGEAARYWMSEYWSPKQLVEQYSEMYRRIQ